MLPLNRHLFIYFYDSDFLKLCFFAQKKVLRKKKKKEKNVNVMSDQFCYLFNMEAQEGQNAKENEKLHVPTWNKVKKRKNCIKTGWTLVLKDEEFQ